MKKPTSTADQTRRLARERQRRYYRRHRLQILQRKAGFYADHREELKVRRVLQR